MKVILNGTVIAESDSTVVIGQYPQSTQMLSSDRMIAENNHYFPPSSIKMELFSDSHTTSVPSIYHDKVTNIFAALCALGKGMSKSRVIAVIGAKIAQEMQRIIMQR